MPLMDFFDDTSNGIVGEKSCVHLFYITVRESEAHEPDAPDAPARVLAGASGSCSGIVHGDF